MEKAKSPHCKKCGSVEFSEEWKCSYCGTQHKENEYGDIVVVDSPDTGKLRHG